MREGYIRSLRLDDLPGGDRCDFRVIDEQVQKYRERQAGSVVSLNKEGVTPENQQEVLARVADQVYDEYLLLCLKDNGGVWEQHNNWLIGLDPDVSLLTEDRLNVRLSPSNYRSGQWTCLPNAFRCTARRFRGTTGVTSTACWCRSGS